MPFKRTPKVSDKPITSVATQLRSLFVSSIFLSLSLTNFDVLFFFSFTSDAERYSALLTAIRDSSAIAHVDVETPVKRKHPPTGLPASPDTPSPKKRKEVGPRVVDTPVITAMAGLGTSATSVVTPTRPLRTRIPTAKAAASQQTSTARNNIHRAPPSAPVVPTVVASSSTRTEKLDLGRPTSPFSILSDDEELPPVANIGKPRKSIIEVLDDTFFDDEAEVDVPTTMPALDDTYDADDEAAADDDIGSLADFIVPDEEYDVVNVTPPPPAHHRRTHKHVISSPVLAPSPIIIPSSQPDEIEDLATLSEDIDNPILSLEVVDDECQVFDDGQAAIDLAEVLAPLIMASATMFGMDGSGSEDDQNPHEETSNYNVMVPGLQNPHMKLTYDDLCTLPSIIAGFLFVRHAIYMNPARIDVGLLCSSPARRLAFAGEGPFCICIMIGIVSECYLIDALDVGTESYPKPRQHRISIIPTQQEERRAISAMCSGLNFAGNPKGFYSYYGMSFITNGEREPVTTTLVDGYHLPKAKAVNPDPLAAMFTVTSSKKRPANQPGYELKYATTNFDNRVPIFDGRAETGEPFRFTSAQFDSILSWRTYEHNAVEVPKGSVVAVGYTTNHYVIKGSLYMPTYVKFVMLLSTPEVVVGVSVRPGTDVLPNRNGKGKARAGPSRPSTRASVKGKEKA
ncbi:hypothetical protein H0H93_002624 [Arthromyces matolae]|nr:hypothetical protein H0H93_002624 [Arthromyces matolae]